LGKKTAWSIVCLFSMSRERERGGREGLRRREKERFIHISYYTREKGGGRKKGKKNHTPPPLKGREGGEGKRYGQQHFCGWNKKGEGNRCPVPFIYSISRRSALGEGGGKKGEGVANGEKKW